jgi:hypothetical protein
MVVEIHRTEAKQKKLFGRTSPRDVLLQSIEALQVRYDKYSHGRKADFFRVSIPYENAQVLLRAMKDAAPGSLRHRWSPLRPPASVTFVSPRG